MPEVLSYYLIALYLQAIHLRRYLQIKEYTIFAKAFHLSALSTDLCSGIMRLEAGCF